MIRFLLFVVFSVITPIAFGHDLDLTLVRLFHGKSQTRIEISTSLSQFVKVHGLGNTPDGLELDRLVRERLRNAVDPRSSVRIDTQADAFMWSGNLNPSGTFELRRFDDSSASAYTIVETYVNGQKRSEQLLDFKRPSPVSSGLLQMGVEHILGGIDHILFVVGLALLGGGWRQILKVLTAFTVAHSITLTAAGLGWTHANPRTIEPLIALSIVALSLEGMGWLRHSPQAKQPVRLGIAFAFGLIHGFGFAEGLGRLGIGGNEMIRNLFTFSVGIEMGQLVILFPSLLLLAFVSHRCHKHSAQLRFAASVALGMIGTFWLFERLI